MKRDTKDLDIFGGLGGIVGMNWIDVHEIGENYLGFFFLSEKLVKTLVTNCKRQKQMYLLRE